MELPSFPTIGLNFSEILDTLSTWGQGIMYSGSMLGRLISTPFIEAIVSIIPGGESFVDSLYSLLERLPDWFEGVLVFLVNFLFNFSLLDYILLGSLVVLILKIFKLILDCIPLI